MSSPGTDSGEHIDLTGVPETMLWILWHRAAEQRRSDRLTNDPLAADLVARIDYDFRGKFGFPNVLPVIRGRLGDDLIREYCQTVSDDPVVVCLGEGLETQAWRVDDDSIQWISVDLPEASAVRQRLLPEHPRTIHIAGSALDREWIDAVPSGATPFISAAGLLMYFQPADVRKLLTMIVQQFPNAWIYFDTIPPLLSLGTATGLYVTPRYKTPRMPWGISLSKVESFLTSIPGLELDRSWTYAEPYPERTRGLRLLNKSRLLRRTLAPGLVLARGANYQA